MKHLLGAFIVLAISYDAARAQSLGQQREVLQPQVLVTTLAAADLAQRASTVTLEHDTEVARSESVTIVVTIASCEKGENGICNVNADVVAYKPDGSVHTEVKSLALNSLRATAQLPLKTDDVTGLYKVVATVRDLNGRRFGNAERIFGVK